VEEIIGAGRRASDLTRQLLAFARKQVIEPVTLHLGDAVRNGGRLLRRVIGEDIRVVEHFQGDLWPVRCDPGLIDQVLMNLVVNARDAMQGGGTLTLSTANVTVDPGDPVPDAEMAPGQYVRLSVADTGTGMSPQFREHIFEPFFTTKAPGVGTGLGLATVYGVVKQSGAFVDVRSAPGRGTTFDIFFPRAEIEEERAISPVPAPSPGTETVLVIEDDSSVRDVTVRALRSAGCHVLAASGAEQALDLLRRERSPLHLLLTDVVLPGLGGREVARRIAELRPGVRVIYMSGYTHDAISQQGVLDEGIEFLPKPFTSAALLARVREVLDRA
jgi:two-component system cell cycle sensor histidine kinase/response regulator CckA